MNALLHDLRYGTRMITREPAFTAIALLTLALGIGANTAIFSVVNAVLLRPLPYTQADRLVWLTERAEQIPNRWVSYPNFLDWQSHNRSFESMATIRGWQMTMTGNGEAQSIAARMVTADYFRVMRELPLIGRDFSAEEDRYGSPGVTIISHGFWQSQFGGDPNVVGKTITLNNRSYAVIGVMRPGFQHQGPPQLWVLTEQYAEPGSGWFTRDVRVAGSVIARLLPGATIEQARADMKSIEEELISRYPMQNGGNTIRVVTLQESIVGDMRQSLLMLFAAVGAVLLIACANVANLLLARAATRQKEFAVRAALGASRWRLVRLLLIESIALAVAGGALGLLLAGWGVDLLIKFAPEGVPRLADAAIGWRVFGFSFLLSILTGIVFGLAPAWQGTKTDLHQMLKEGGRSASDARGGRLRSAFVVAEVAVSVVLLVGAGLLIRSLARLLASDPGFNAGNVLTMQLLPRDACPGREKLVQFHTQLLERISELPSVEAACVLNDLPGFEPGWQNDINPEVNGEYLKIKPGELINVDWGIISSNYFAAMGIPIREGRSFTPQEVERGDNVVIVDEQLARRFWPAGDAIGKHIKYDPTGPQEIVGIAGDVRNYGSEGLGRIKIYTPFGHSPLPRSTLAVRCSGTDPLSLVASVKSEVQAINPNVPISDVSTLEAQLASYIVPRRFNTRLLGLFAAVALVLAAVGIYGVMSYAVTQRTRELGIRLALGAQTRDVMTLTLSQSMRLVVAGLGLGLLASLVLTRSLKSMLYGVSATDPLTLALVSVFLTAVAMLACWLPAKRAARVDPMIALRYE
ncbi:MAG TPA: ABC transporter permease [Blastocatellia bacterium]|nr:ABC transporter permease [Blastocatellia bacterium]